MYNSMTGTPVIKKIGGKPVRFEHEKDGYVCLSSISKIELLDLLEREQKLLSNKKFIERLPDKGEKIKMFKNKIQCELEKRDKQRNLCHLLSNLNLNESKESINELEWTERKKNAMYVNHEKDEDLNLLKILATHSGTDVSRSKLLKTEQTACLKSFDTVEEKKKKNETFNFPIDVFAKELCSRLDNTTGKEEKRKFHTHRLSSESFAKSVKKLEPGISSAYFPEEITAKTKLISLTESIILHKQQMNALQELELKYAIEKLAQKPCFNLRIPENSVDSYRDQSSSDVTNNNSDEESIE